MEIKSADVLLHLHQSSGVVETFEWLQIAHIPRSGDTIRLVLPGDRDLSDYVVSDVRHELVPSLKGTYKLSQIEIIARRKPNVGMPVR